MIKGKYSVAVIMLGSRKVVDRAGFAAVYRTSVDFVTVFPFKNVFVPGVRTVVVISGV